MRGGPPVLNKFIYGNAYKPNWVIDDIMDNLFTLSLQDGNERMLEILGKAMKSRK